MSEDMILNNNISTEVKRRKKPHEKFKAIIQFDSTPTELSIQANKTDVNIIPLSKSLRKYSFGKVVAQNKNSLEFYMYPYPYGSLDHIDLSLKQDFSAKKPIFFMDKRKLGEVQNVLRRIGYFLGLSRERKLEYLRKHGFSVNINITKGDNADD
jgi:hypothetical protein